MGKIKVKRKSTLIDMTAMSDVTVLLLTFFMLTSTFLQKEPVQVITPPSVATDKVPTSNVAQILVATDDKENPKVFLSFFGEADPDYPEADENNPDIYPGMYASEPLRKEIAKQAVKEYESITGDKLGMTEADYDNFSKIGSFGVPFKQLKEFVNDSKQDEFMKEHANDALTGIPLKPLKGSEFNELQIWLRALRSAASPRLADAIKKDGTGLAVKADRDTKFSKINEVLESMRNIKMNKFTVMTALAAESEE